MATLRFRRALRGYMTEFLRVVAISAETVEFSGEQRNDSPPSSNKKMDYASAAGHISWRSNMLRLAYADSGSVCKLAQEMVPTAHTRNDVRFRSGVLGSNLFASRAVGKFSRASSAGDRRRL